VQHRFADVPLRAPQSAAHNDWFNHLVGLASPREVNMTCFSVATSPTNRLF
jgi:hypothetical protein